MFGESDKVSIGVVIRNSDGEVMAALLEKIKKPSSVEALKPLVARQVVSFTLESGFANCTFEGDFELVVKSYMVKVWKIPKGDILLKIFCLM